MAGSAAPGGRTLSRDFKHVRRHAPGAPGQGFTGWVGLGVGLGIGLSVALGVHVYYKNVMAVRAEPIPVAAQAPASATATDDATAIAASGGQPAQEFEFYDMLPKQEVDVPAAKPVSRNDATSQRLPTGDVVLQAGSFKQPTEAEKMVAQLALAGVESKVQRASVQDETWYRVRIGPIHDLAELNRIRKQLQAAEVDGLVIRVGD